MHKRLEARSSYPGKFTELRDGPTTNSMANALRAVERGPKKKPKTEIQSTSTISMDDGQPLVIGRMSMQYCRLLQRRGYQLHRCPHGGYSTLAQIATSRTQEGHIGLLHRKVDPQMSCMQEEFSCKSERGVRRTYASRLRLEKDR
jgi:hypothetical protein